MIASSHDGKIPVICVSPGEKQEIFKKISWEIAHSFLRSQHENIKISSKANNSDIKSPSTDEKTASEDQETAVSEDQETDDASEEDSEIDDDLEVNIVSVGGGGEGPERAAALRASGLIWDSFGEDGNKNQSQSNKNQSSQSKLVLPDLAGIGVRVWNFKSNPTPIELMQQLRYYRENGEWDSLRAGKQFVDENGRFVGSDWEHTLLPPGVIGNSYNLFKCDCDTISLEEDEDSDSVEKNESSSAEEEHEE